MRLKGLFRKSSSKNNLLITKNQCPIGCPKCGKSDLIGDDQSQDGDYVIFPFTCNDCNFSWSEIYKFENWEEEI